MQFGDRGESKLWSLSCRDLGRHGLGMERWELFACEKGNRTRNNTWNYWNLVCVCFSPSAQWFGLVLAGSGSVDLIWSLSVWKCFSLCISECSRPTDKTRDLREKRISEFGSVDAVTTRVRQDISSMRELQDLSPASGPKSDMGEKWYDDFGGDDRLWGKLSMCPNEFINHLTVRDTGIVTDRLRQKPLTIPRFP